MRDEVDDTLNFLLQRQCNRVKLSHITLATIIPQLGIMESIPDTMTTSQAKVSRTSTRNRLHLCISMLKISGKDYGVF